MTISNRDRRHFSRVSFQAKAEFHQGSHSWEAQVLDLSLCGLQTDLPDDQQLQPQKLVRAVIHLAKDTVIQMTLRLAHASGGRMGFHCESIDLDSISHLRNLVALNMGDSQACEQELARLGS